MTSTSASNWPPPRAVAIMPPSQMSGHFGPAHQVAEARVGAQVVEIAVAAQHSLGVESRVERLGEPLEGGIDVSLPGFRAGEIVERGGLAVAECEGAGEVFRRLRLFARVQAGVASVEE